MTKDGKENRFGRFVFEDGQAERVAAGDYSAVWEFMEDNGKYLLNWARKFVRTRLSFLPEDRHGSFYKPEELINQIYVDFPFYTLESEKTLANGVWRSFRGITCGGFLRFWKARHNRETSFDAPLTVSERNGEKTDGNTLKDLLPSREPPPDEVIEKREHVEEVAPRFYHEIGRLFGENGTESGGATVGELIAFQAGRQASAFQDVIEEVFYGYTFEEVQAYARRTA